MSESRKVPLQAYKTKELAALYKVSKRTFCKWIKPFRKAIGERVGQYFTVVQVLIIFESIGWPPAG